MDNKFENIPHQRLRSLKDGRTILEDLSLQHHTRS